MRGKAAEQIGVVFVSHGSGSWLGVAIRSVARHLPGAEIIVVENGEDKMPRCHGDAVDRLTVARNEGFGAGCNVGAALAGRSHLLFLNPDARLALCRP